MIREKLIRDMIIGKEVLDLGSLGQTNSYSLWNDVYKNSGYKSLTGIDLEDASQTALSHFNVKPSKLPSDSRIVYGNFETYQFGKQFDVIVAGDLIEHVNNQGLLLQNVHRHLKTEGVFILTTPNSKWLTGFLKPNPTHVLWHDEFTLRRVLNINKFEIEKLIYYFGNKKNYNYFLRILALRQSIFVICKKK